MMTGGRGGAISTDERGRFQFDSVSPGVYTITVHHPVLDSIGVFGLSTHATIAEGETEIHLAVPSFATLWRTAGSCTAPSATCAQERPWSAPRSS